ncbi:hypothetical protein N1851_018409 [Merluccius polli]|uniref:Uncharacterized protein n=1 Tax=Merluccius polli TaxID=89951 RepID=A0AA47MNN9_MERPO|nr:hypothetical protein N1851_018409 [Merluccius polli]
MTVHTFIHNLDTIVHVLQMSATAADVERTLTLPASPRLILLVAGDEVPIGCWMISIESRVICEGIQPTFITGLAAVFATYYVFNLQYQEEAARTLEFVQMKRRRRGRRAGALVRLRQRGLRTPLPGIFLSNVRSLPNKLEELQLLLGKNRDFPSSAVLCFMETWLSGLIPDSALHLAGFQLCRADRDTELSGKNKGGGICFYINSGWCNDVTVIQQHCSPDLRVSLFPHLVVKLYFAFKRIYAL